MRNQQVRWRLRQDEIDHLSNSLKPMRSCEEVAQILGCSESLVRQIEHSALRKIIRAMADFEKNGMAPRS
jgi:DNA-directed RNA polymerase sigma subunit (sigma70/sigma32)